MEKKTIIIVAAALIGLVTLFYWGKASDKSNVPGNQANAESKLSASEILYDFGTISMKNGNVEKVFTVTNNSGEDVNVKSVQTSCMCTKAFIKSGSSEKGPFGMPGMGFLPPANEVIKAGESRAVRVVYDPNAHGPAGVGPIDRFVHLTDDAGNTLELEIKALVTP